MLNTNGPQNLYTIKNQLIAILKSRTFRLSFGVGLIVLLIEKIGYSNLLETISNLSITDLLVLYALNIIVLLLGGLNYYLLLNSVKIVEKAIFLRCYIASWSASFFFPSQIGDASLIVLLKKKANIDVSVSSVVYLLDKVFTLVPYVIISLFGFFFYLRDMRFVNNNWTIIVFIILGGTGFGVILYFSKIKNSLFFKDSKDCLKELMNNRVTLAINVFITILKISITIVIYYYCFQMFEPDIEILTVAVIPIMSSFVGYLPISIGGIGTVEATAIGLFNIASVDATVVLTSYLVLRSINYSLAVMTIFISSTILFKRR